MDGWMDGRTDADVAVAFAVAVVVVVVVGGGGGGGGAVGVDVAAGAGAGAGAVAVAVEVAVAVAVVVAVAVGGVGAGVGVGGGEGAGVGGLTSLPALWSKRRGENSVASFHLRLGGQRKKVSGARPPFISRPSRPFVCIENIGEGNGRFPSMYGFGTKPS